MGQSGDSAPVCSREAGSVQTICIHFAGHQSVERVICESYSSRRTAVIRSSLSAADPCRLISAVSVGWSSGVHVCRVFACTIDHSIRRCLRKDCVDHEIHRPVLPRPLALLPAASVRHVHVPARRPARRALRSPFRPEHRSFIQRVKQFTRVSDVWLDNRKSIWVDVEFVARSSSQLGGADPT